MTTLITVLVVLVFAALLYVFYRMQKRHTKFSTRVFTALGVGIVFGGLLQLIFGVDDKSRYSINGMDRDCRSRICIILANASYAFSVYFDHWCIHKNESF